MQSQEINLLMQRDELHSRPTSMSTITGKPKIQIPYAILKSLMFESTRTTSGSRPPKSVSDNWPRNLSTSVALYGKQAKPITTPIVKFEALEASRLVVRSVAVQTPEAMSVTVEDAPKSITVQNGSADTVANPPETVKEKSVLTWNARIRVKK